MPLSDQQIQRMLLGVGKNRVAGRSQGGSNVSYIPQHEVRAELIRTFGFGNFDVDIHDVKCLYEEQRNGSGNNKDKVYWFVGYRVACTLTIRDYEGNQIAQYTEYHAEENAPQPNRGEAHALALTACESYAMRRAAINLGDRFGLGLYNAGSMTPIVKGSLQMVERDTKAPAPQAGAAAEVPADADTPVHDDEPGAQDMDRQDQPVATEAQVDRAFGQVDEQSGEVMAR